MLFPALVIAVSSWWLLTGLALLLVHQSHDRVRLGFLALSILALVAWALVPFTVSSSEPLAAALGFILGLLIWGWLEVSYLLGYVNGPNHEVCDKNATMWQRFKGGVATTIYHEVCVLLSVGLLAVMSLGQVNPTAFYTLTVLWLMRWSAKLNLFLGVRSFNDRWLPDHLHYLASYLKTDRLNPFLPLSTLIGFYATYSLFGSASAATEITQQLSLNLIATLMLLASIEHLFLMFPLNDAALWSWARENVTPLRAVRDDKDDL
jgi:putative photosynthetic complex assembly protein 2